MVAKKSVKKKKDIWYCWHCAAKIDPSERVAVLGTYENKKEIEVAYFHFICWKDYFQEKVRDAAKKMQTAGSVMENIGKQHNLLGMIGNLSKFLPKNFSFNLKNIQDIDPKEIQRVLRECGVDQEETKKKNARKKTTKKRSAARKSK